LQQFLGDFSVPVADQGVIKFLYSGCVFLEFCR